MDFLRIIHTVDLLLHSLSIFHSLVSRPPGLCKNMGTQPREQRRLGGHRAVFFVYVMEGLENMALIANSMSLVTYFFGYMNFRLTKSATTLTNFMATAFLLALVGGFICDTYLSRFKTCVLFACLELLGYGLLTVQAHFHQLRPFPCKGLATTQGSQCEAASGGQAAILYTGLYLVALGTSGIKAALLALGADQFDEKDPKEAAQLSSFYNWFLLSLNLGSLFGVTFIVWISSNLGWDRSFAVCTVAILFATLFIWMGKPLYRHNIPKGSPILRIIQVFVAAFRNRKFQIPETAGELHEINENERGDNYEVIHRTDQFRFLDRAAIVRDSDTSRGNKNLNPHASNYT